mmetsp:Transcript_153477/g.490628  ORF Transcript_153477/g.490628 Transcript_153477/m.490628 type:complete len:244 (-) Transcript_153477:1062-1793(-)
MRLLRQLCGREQEGIPWELDQRAQCSVEHGNVVWNEIALYEDAEVAECCFTRVVEEGAEKNRLGAKKNVRGLEFLVSGKCHKHVVAHLPRVSDLKLLESPTIQTFRNDMLCNQIAPAWISFTRGLGYVLAVVSFDGCRNFQRWELRALVLCKALLQAALPLLLLGVRAVQSPQAPRRLGGGRAPAATPPAARTSEARACRAPTRGCAAPPRVGRVARTPTSDKQPAPVATTMAPIASSLREWL